jgi:hypothetical protein
MSRIPNGTYRARAIDSKHGTTKKGGIEIAIGFQLLDEQWAGHTITGYVYFTDNTDDERSMESLEACGWTGEGIELDPLPGLGSCETELVIEIETYEGKERSKVKYINRLGAVSTAAPLSSEQQRAFAARMRAKIAARKAKNGGRPAAARPATGGNTANGQDDIPF